ncbi:hypothetical protein [Bosea sp. BIWAKO-01]|uniref:hypothetical protein n=1 Tax=Bosea sp. BIWAKO-01 TaxID=506668 RepID=UPI00086D291A|nr:hypothetical protein [Bosea sp. BIWAKO-01]GAU87096.1 hypothetical protein BIWAKO_07049 [Bosea sp. BIWAKO-01]
MSLASSHGIAAANLVSSATMAGLLRSLVQKGILEAADIREIYEIALLILEQQQGAVPGAEATFNAARSAIERKLA